MAYQVRRATAADIPAICDAYLSAFSEDPISIEVFPRASGTGYNFWINTLADDVDDEKSHFLVATSPQSVTPDTIIAFAKWGAPGAPMADAPPADVWPQDGDTELAARFFGELAEAHPRLMGDAPHWYLEMVGVRMEWVGKGASSPLVRWGLERADADGSVCYLESSEEAKPIYERYGFSVVGEYAVETRLGKVVEYFMTRPAK